MAIGDIPVISPKDNLQEEAERIFGPNAYVPLSDHDPAAGPTLGYLEVQGVGVYEVVSIKNEDANGDL